MVGSVYEATGIAVAPQPSGRVCMAALTGGVLGADAEGNPILIIEGQPPVRIEWTHPGAHRVETEPIFRIYNNYGELLAEEGQWIELHGGFNEDETVFMACGFLLPPRLDPQ